MKTVCLFAAIFGDVASEVGVVSKVPASICALPHHHTLVAHSSALGLQLLLRLRVERFVRFVFRVEKDTPVSS